MAANAPLIVTSTVGAAADVFHLTSEVKQVVVENYHATALVYVKVFTGATSAAAVAKATASPATVAGNDCFVVAAGKRKAVLKSSRGNFVALSIIASGAATTFTVEGTEWKD